MDSPSPRSEHMRLNEIDDENNNSLASVWNSFRTLHRVLSVLVISLIIAALIFSSLPLWNPMGAFMLQKLWDALRFLVLATSIGLGIVNRGLWRGASDETDSAASSAGKEDSVRSKVPFAGMFYGEGLHSYSFSEKGTGASEHGLKDRSEPETRDVGSAADSAAVTDRDHDRDLRLEGGQDVTAATLSDEHHGNEVSLRAHDDRQLCMLPARLADSTGRAGISHDGDGDRPDDFHHYRGEINEAAKEDEVGANQAPTYKCRNSENTVLRGKNRLVKPYDDLGMAAVAQQPKQSRNSKVVHRRGNSLEFPLTQGSDASTLDNHTDIRELVYVTKKGTEPSSGSRLAARHVEQVDGGVPGTASRHSRSQSAYKLDELPVQQRPRSKPSTSGQLSRRRNVSLSCDLDKEFSSHGMPAWLASLPSPPVPPGYAGVESQKRHAEIAEVKEQDEISLRRALTEDLAPWRAITNTIPVRRPTYIHKEAVQGNITGPSNKIVEKQRVNTSPTDALGSPSPRELNKKVDAFITRFRERMRLQRLESLERLRQSGHQ